MWLVWNYRHKTDRQTRQLLNELTNINKTINDYEKIQYENIYERNKNIARGKTYHGCAD